MRRRRKKEDPGPASADSGEPSARQDGGEAAPEQSGRLHSADSPIEDFSDDLLGREPFALALAADIRHAPVRSGFVVGLTGEWGSGKTSILKLVAKDLEDGDVAAVVTFNPWLFSGTEQLINHFFAELSGQIELGSSGNLGALSTALSAYGRLVSPLTVVPFAGEILRVTGEAATGIGETIKPEEASAHVQAEKLKGELAKLDHPVLVLVDDLDRLRPDEIVDVVRLVRLVGDFPNLIYLIAFDQAVVEEALGDNSGGSGRAYLEKIIHISHALPPIRHEDLTVVLRDALAETIPEPSAHRFDEERFGSLFWSDVRPLFKTIRDVRRFTNILRTTLELLGDEVDLADTLALEAIRLFEPEVFGAIVDERYLLTDTVPPQGRADFSRLFRQGDDPADRDRIEEILQHASRRETVKTLLVQLFPAADRLLRGNTFDRGSASAWKAARRVAAGEPLDVYLHRRLAPGVLPAREVEEVLSLFADRQALSIALEGLDEDGLRNLYTRLGDYEGDYPEEGLPAAIEAIMWRGVGFGDTFSDMSGSMLLRRLLDAVPESDRGSMLADLDYPNLSRRYELIRAVGYREDSGHGMVPEAEATELADALVADILAAEAGVLAAEPDLPPLIGLVGRRDRDGLVNRLNEWLQDDRFLVLFVAAHQLIKVASGDRRVVQLDWPSLLDVIDVDRLRELLEAVDPSWVEESFDEDSWNLWRQALLYCDHPEDADEALRGWPDSRGGDPDRV